MTRKRFGRSFSRRGCVNDLGRPQTKKNKEKENGKTTSRSRSGWHKQTTTGVRSAAVEN